MVNLRRAVNVFSTGHPSSLVNGTVRFFNRWQTVSAVLRKKIDAGVGIPPSILRLASFWLQLQTLARNWAADAYGLIPDITLSNRRVVNGIEAQRKLEEETGFYFAADVSPALAGVAIDATGAIRNAAVRMAQEVDSLCDASPLFLKLLAEQASLGLCQSVSSALLNTDHNVTATADPSVSAGHFSGANRYLLIEYELQMEGGASRIWFAFSYDFIEKYVALSQRDTAEQKARARHHSRKSLSDSVLASTATLDAVLERVTMTIGECAKLEVGAILPLSGADAGRLSLSADTISGSVDIGAGELGVWKRQRALKLTTPISAGFAQEIVDS
jgi:flagellar motor switch/type III secretory pathway protein FliN